MKYVEVDHDGKSVFSGHWPKHEGKVALMARLLKKYGWCFPPVPVVDLGDYYQALDGSHRLGASKKLNIRPELVVVDLRIHPDQPLPKGWKIIVNAPLVHSRTIRGYGLSPHPQEDHMGAVLDENRELLRVEYVDLLFRLLVQLTRKSKIFRKG